MKYFASLIISSAIVMLSIVSNVSIPKTGGYWTDGYWDDVSGTWIEGFWTEVPDEILSTPSYTPKAVSTIQVGSYKANLVRGMDQWIVDMKKTAAFFEMNGKKIIADHSTQGFAIIRSARTAYYGNRKLKLASRYFANWTYDSLQLEDGRDFTEPDDGWMIMYTCTDDGATVTYWN